MSCSNVRMTIRCDRCGKEDEIDVDVSYSTSIYAAMTSHDWFFRRDQNGKYEHFCEECCMVNE